MQPAPEKIQEVVQRIVLAVHPQRIILFGSAARGEMKPDSDLDVLVVMPEGTHRRFTAQKLYPLLVGVNIAVDILVATPGDLERYRETGGLIYRDILREGRELYAA